jgi:hypothetical protein
MKPLFLNSFSSNAGFVFESYLLSSGFQMIVRKDQSAVKEKSQNVNQNYLER